MRKLSVLIALALCLTIGGAYAAWTFAAGQVAFTPVTKSVNMTIVVDETTPSGTLTATYDPAFEVVPASSSDYTPEIVDNNTADLTITFTPADNAVDSIKANGIAVTVTIKSSGFTGDVISINYSETINPGEWTKDGNNFTYTIEDTEILDAITLTAGGDGKLDTYAEASAFLDKLDPGVLTVSITSNVTATETDKATTN